MEAFSFLKSVISIPFNLFKEFVPSKKTKKKSGFMDSEFMEKYNELSAGRENYFEKYRLRTGSTPLPNTQVNLTSGGSSFNFTNPPSIEKSDPVINDASSLHKYKTKFAISSGLPILPRGWVLERFLNISFS